MSCDAVEVKQQPDQRLTVVVKDNRQVHEEHSNASSFTEIDASSESERTPDHADFDMQEKTGKDVPCGTGKGSSCGRRKRRHSTGDAVRVSSSTDASTYNMEKKRHEGGSDSTNHYRMQDADMAGQDDANDMTNEQGSDCANNMMTSSCATANGESELQAPTNGLCANSPDKVGDQDTRHTAAATAAATSDSPATENTQSDVSQTQESDDVAAMFEITDCDAVLMDVGRKPNSAGLGLDEVGVKLGEQRVIHTSLGGVVRM